MAIVIVQMKIMPESPDTDLKAVQVKAEELMKEFGSKGDIKTEIEPIAFGLKALMMTLAVDESGGSTDDLEDKLKEVDGVNSVEVTGVSRALG